MIPSDKCLGTSKLGGISRDVILRLEVNLKILILDRLVYVLYKVFLIDRLLIKFLVIVGNCNCVITLDPVACQLGAIEHCLGI